MPRVHYIWLVGGAWAEVDPAAISMVIKYLICIIYAKNGKLFISWKLFDLPSCYLMTGRVYGYWLMFVRAAI